MPDTDPFASRINDAIAEALAAGELLDGGMVRSFVLVATYYGVDGDTRAVFATNPDAVLHETLGLLDTAQATYRAAAVDWVRGIDDP